MTDGRAGPDGRVHLKDSTGTDDVMYGKTNGLPFSMKKIRV